MALYGVLGDIHGNKEALLAVLDFLDQQGVDELLCVGDVVGFNADPIACIAIMQERRIIAIAGNHDLISIGRLGLDRCSDKAAYALKRTRLSLRKPALAFLEALEPIKILEGWFALVHGGIGNPQLYMRTAAQIKENAALLQANYPGVRLCFFGHTHEQRLFEVNQGAVSEIAAEGEVHLRHGPIYFINPGSVDAARKSDTKLAECVVFDSEKKVVKFHRVPYDHRTAEMKAKAGGYRMDAATAWLYSLTRRARNRVRRRSVTFLASYLP